MKVIGLTGGIASGKSTVSGILSEHGFAIVDADKIAWQLAAPDNPLWQAYYGRYGAGVLHEDRTLNRQAVADIVFRLPAEKQWMDSTAHPMIKAEIKRSLAKWAAKGRELVFLDVPLLYEAGWEKMTDEIWVVYVDQATQIQRLCHRSGCSEQEALRRINAQLSMDEKKRRAHVVLDNRGGLAELRQKLHRQLLDSGFTL